MTDDWLISNNEHIMDSVSISQLKMNPAAVFLAAQDYPVAVDSRNQTTGYVVGKKLFEKIIEKLEDWEDRKAIDSAIKSGELENATDFEEFARELGI